MGAILPDATLEALARALALSLPGTDRVSVSVLGVLATGYPARSRRPPGSGQAAR